MHAYYTQRLSSTEQRINAAIQGVHIPGAQLSAIRDKYENYLPWLDQHAVFSIRFEDLILDRTSTLGKILDYLATQGFTPLVSRDQAIEKLSSAIVPSASGTFRRGQPGEWREHFTLENKRIFKTTTGDLLQQLGYEKDDSW
jgi:hypothetical protein